MNQDELKRTFRDATASPPPGSRERVWRALDTPRAPARSAFLIPLIACTAVVLLGVTALALRARPTELRWNDPHSVVLWKSAHATFDVPSRQINVERGEVALSSWGGPPLVLTAAGHTVRVEAGVAVVRVAGDSVKVSVVDGAAWFDGTSVRETDRMAAGELGQDVLKLESAIAQPRRLLARADDFIASREFDGAVAAYATIAELGGLDAEVALYKQGELELRELGTPERALATFQAGETRFPNGALTQERQLSSIEACVKLNEWCAVRGRTESFLAQHADSERAAEVRALHEAALVRCK